MPDKVSLYIFESWFSDVILRALREDTEAKSQALAPPGRFPRQEERSLVEWCTSLQKYLAPDVVEELTEASNRRRKEAQDALFATLTLSEGDTNADV